MKRAPAKLMFSVTDDNEIYLHINDRTIVPFDNLEEWQKFANDMLGMVDEMKQNYRHLSTEDQDE